jgi:predicted dehydrogenase
VVGVGASGSAHASILAASAAAELAVCVDIDPEAVHRVPTGVALRKSLEESISEFAPEAVLVCTPQSRHLDDVRVALAHGLHVFCEKPLADTLANADAIVDLAADQADRLVVGHMYRFDSRYRRIADAIHAGKLGRIVHASWRVGTPDHEGMTLAGRTTLAMENAVHGLDLLRWLVGNVRRVYAETSRTGVAGEGRPDSLSVVLAFESGAVGSLEVDWALPTAAGISITQQVEVVGSEGVAWIRANEIDTAILTKSSPPTVHDRDFVDLDPHGVPFGIYRIEIESFLGRVRDGRRWPVTLDDAREAVRLAQAVDLSLAAERPILISDVR